MDKMPTASQVDAMFDALETTREQARLHKQFMEHMDHLDDVYGRDTKHLVDDEPEPRAYAVGPCCALCEYE